MARLYLDQFLRGMPKRIQVNQRLMRLWMVNSKNTLAMTEPRQMGQTLMCEFVKLMQTFNLHNVFRIYLNIQ